MKQFTITVNDPNGLHARPAGQLAKAAAGFKSRVVLEKNGRTADSRRLMAIMALCVKQGEAVHITVEGEDEDAAAKALAQFFSTQCS